MNLKKRVLSSHLTIFRGFNFAVDGILLRISVMILMLAYIYFIAYDVIFSNYVYENIAKLEFGSNFYEMDHYTALCKFHILYPFYILNFHNTAIISYFTFFVLGLYLRISQKLKFIYYLIYLKFIIKI